MSLRVELSLIERTLNALGRANRKRSGSALTRMAEEADVLRAAFKEVEAAAEQRGREEAFKQAIAICEDVAGYWAMFHSVAPSAVHDCAKRIVAVAAQGKAGAPSAGPTEKGGHVTTEKKGR